MTYDAIRHFYLNIYYICQYSIKVILSSAFYWLVWWKAIHCISLKVYNSKTGMFENDPEILMICNNIQFQISNWHKTYSNVFIMSNLQIFLYPPCLLKSPHHCHSVTKHTLLLFSWCSGEVVSTEEPWPWTQTSWWPCTELSCPSWK